MPTAGSSERDLRLLAALTEPAAELFERHLASTKVWYPFEDVPFDDARTVRDGASWDPAEYPLSEGIRSALVVNLLTEDNLPYYTSTLLGAVPAGHPLDEWSRRWTAEEWRHSAAMRDWMLATRAVDPYQLEDDRMAQMAGGVVPQAPTFAEMIAYVALQELATQVAHRNTGRQLDRERQGKLVMSKIAGDEGLHHAFYRDLVLAALQVDPSYLVVAIARQLRGFKMPGTGIPGFADHEVKIAAAGIFDATQYVEMVVQPTLAAWNLEELTGLDDEAERARESIRRTVSALSRIAARSARASVSA